MFASFENKTLSIVFLKHGRLAPILVCMGFVYLMVSWHFVLYFSKPLLNSTYTRLLSIYLYSKTKKSCVTQVWTYKWGWVPLLGQPVQSVQTGLLHANWVSTGGTTGVNVVVLQINEFFFLNQTSQYDKGKDLSKFQIRVFIVWTGPSYKKLCFVFSFQPLSQMK